MNSQPQFDSDLQEIRELVWSNKIPLKLILDPRSVSNDTPPLPLYIFFRRVSYPIFYFNEIHSYFEKFAPVPLNEHDIWLEWGKDPVPWHLPFGLTFDLLYEADSELFSSSESSSSANSSQNYTPFYPITLIVHYGGYPQNSEMLPLEKNKSLFDIAQRHFKFSIKESLLIRNNNTTSILTQVSLDEQVQFLTDLKDGNYERFFPILDTIFSYKIHLSNNYTVKLPLRIYIKNYPGRIQIQEPILTGKETVGDLISKTFPKILKISENSYEAASTKYKGIQIVCNGISIDLSVPLIYFFKHFFHYDGFTYMCLKF